MQSEARQISPADEYLLNDDLSFWGIPMPVISMFYGVLVKLYPLDTSHRHVPHIHVAFAEHEAVYAIGTGRKLAGSLPRAKHRLVLAWIELHGDELQANWDLAAAGLEPFRIEPLR